MSLLQDDELSGNSGQLGDDELLEVIPPTSKSPHPLKGIPFIDERNEHAFLQDDELNIANWTAERMRNMHYPIVEGKFMDGGLTPHQYLTKEIEALISQREEVIEREARLDEFETTSKIWGQDGASITPKSIGYKIRDDLIKRRNELTSPTNQKEER